MCISSFLQISGPHPELYLIKWSGTARERSVHLKNPPQRLKSVSISKYNNAIWKTLENSVSSKLCICQSKYYNSFSVINNYDLQCSTIHDSITKAIHQNELLSYQKFLFVNTFLQNTMLSRKNIKKEKTKEKKKKKLYSKTPVFECWVCEQPRVSPPWQWAEKKNPCHFPRILQWFCRAWPGISIFFP